VTKLISHLGRGFIALSISLKTLRFLRLQRDQRLTLWYIGKRQIPPDLVVKTQTIDIVEVIA
jgi:hypothetical protein